MLNGMFLYVDPGQSIGVQKKVKAQIKVLGEHYNLQVKTIVPSFAEKAYQLLPFSSHFFKVDYDEIASLDFIFIRKPTFDAGFIDFLKRCRRKNSRIKILLEIPTYPYFNEANSLVMKRKIAKDKRNYPKLAEYVDRVVTYSQEDYIFNIPTIKLFNGCDIGNISFRNYKPHSGHTDLLCVATFSFWHGYERLIRGLSTYYQAGGAEKIVIHMVGGGAELPYYKGLVKELSLESNFIFYGPLYGSDLDRLYDIADLAIDSLGWYKKGANEGSPIKAAEYFAKGIPVVLGYKLTYLPEKCRNIALVVPNDASDIDICELLNYKKEFYSGDYLSKMIGIREFAIQKVDMRVALEPVIQYLHQ